MDHDVRKRPASRDGARAEAVEAQRQRILGAALGVFSHNGYWEATVSAIAREAGVSYGLVHHYFGSKEQLFTVVVETGLESLKQARELALKGSRTPDERLRRWVYALTRVLSEMDPLFLYRKLVMQMMGVPAKHPAASVEALNRYTAEETHLLTNMLTDQGLPSEQAANLACVTFNVLLGSQLAGMGKPDHLDLLYRTGCHLLRVEADPVPDLLPVQPLPWAGEPPSDAHGSPLPGKNSESKE